MAGPEKDGGGWSVFFVSEGLEPADVRAWTLTEAIENASAAVASLYAKHSSADGAELQLVIYPWDYGGGPIFDVSGPEGSLIARDIQGSDLAIHGATLEDLVAAVEGIPGLAPNTSMLRWIRLVTSSNTPNHAAVGMNASGVTMSRPVVGETIGRPANTRPGPATEPVRASPTKRQASAFATPIGHLIPLGPMLP